MGCEIERASRKAAFAVLTLLLLAAPPSLAGLEGSRPEQRGGPDDDQYYQIYKGRVTVPVANALGLPCHLLKGPDDYRLIEGAARQAYLARIPVVVLMTRAALLGGGEKP